jgi:hypothetical protein
VLSPGQTGSCGGCNVMCSGTADVCCNGFCRNLDSDVQNCGQCLAACASGQFCCGGGCTGPDNPSACGGCGIVCPEFTICQGGQCIPGCPTGTLTCNGQCLDVTSDNFNCGACNYPCADGSYCQLGQCAPNVCPPLQTFCPFAGGCINTSANRTHCGDCVTSCPNGACTSGQCVCLTTMDCGMGLTCHPSTITTQLLTPSGAQTVTGPGPGYCATPNCPVAGQQYCSSTQSCTSILIDPYNCGQCGTVCSSGHCTNGMCTCNVASDCPPGSDCVGSLCVLH